MVRRKDIDKNKKATHADFTQMAILLKYNNGYFV